MVAKANTNFVWLLWLLLWISIAVICCCYECTDYYNGILGCCYGVGIASFKELWLLRLLLWFLYLYVGCYDRVRSCYGCVHDWYDGCYGYFVYRYSYLLDWSQQIIDTCSLNLSQQTIDNGSHVISWLCYRTGIMWSRWRCHRALIMWSE